MTSRRKGHNAERYYVKEFKELGFQHCITSRYGSRVHDDAGIDLLNVPINVQIKCGKQRGMNPSDVILYMKERIKELFPPESPENDKINIVIHRKEAKRGRGITRKDEDDIVHMTFNDFKKLIKNAKNNSTI